MTSRNRSPVPALVVSLVVALVVATLTLLAPPGTVGPAEASGAVATADPPPGPPATRPPAARRVAKDDCRRIDPNLVRGACLRYSTPRGSGLTWIGSYRAPDGRVFFCIDYLYDSRLPRQAERVSTQRLVNQLGKGVGDAEVAALNRLVSTWAPRGSTGSDDRDAAIALIVREVMGDGTRPGGLVVYPSGLRVGGTVRQPVGGLDATTMRLAQEMWRDASATRGPWRVRFDLVGAGPVRLGQVRSYRVAVVSAAQRSVPGVRVRFQCWGATTCPEPVTTGRRTTVVRLRPTDVGPFSVVARVTGPSSDGVLYRQRGWSTHGGTTARPAGVQRGWIAQSNPAAAAVRASTRVEKAQPAIMTVTSHSLVRPGARIHDRVTVKNLPPGYDGVVVAELHGPFASRPGPDDCSTDTLAGRVTRRVTHGGTYDTPSVVVREVGYYTWVQRLPADIDTLPVTTPCGLREETTKVEPRRPGVTTEVSDQRALTGDRLHDTVRLTGLASTDTVTVRWRLYGPVAPKSSRSCAGVRWSSAPVAASGGREHTGSGTFRTPSVLLKRPGCYTYSQRVLPTALTTGASSPPGFAVETSLVTRPVTPVVPEVPTGRAGGGLAAVGRAGGTGEPSPYVPQRRAEPRWLDADYRAPAASARAAARRTPAGRLTVSRVGLDLAVDSVGLDSGEAIAVPDDRDHAGWLRTTAAPGDVIGASVIAGHVSDGSGRMGALRAVRRGDVVRWTSGGRTERFEVRAVHRYPRTRGVPAELFRTNGQRVLHLITCTTARRMPNGRIHNLDNLVVTAVRVG